MSNKLVGIALTFVVEGKEAESIMPSHGQYRMKLNGKQVQFKFKTTKINERIEHGRKLLTITESDIEPDTENIVPAKKDITEKDSEFENCILYLNHTEINNIKIIDGSMRFADGHILIMSEKLLKALQKTLIIM